jgi:hypothetical protein
MRRNPVATAVVAVGLCLVLVGAVTTTQHETYALRPCSTCTEIRYPTKAECEAAALAEAQRVGATRTTGSAVYTCITRHNVIATFRPNPVTGTAVVGWAHDGLNTTEYRVTHWRDGELPRIHSIAGNQARAATISNLPAGSWSFQVVAAYCQPDRACNVSNPSETRGKVIL